MTPTQFAVGTSIAALALIVPGMTEAPKAPPTEAVHYADVAPCRDMSLSVYFSNHETMLSSYSLRALNTAGDQLAGCKIRKIDAKVVSADAGNGMHAEQLSQARTAAVLDALSARGVQSGIVRTEFLPLDTFESRDTGVAPPLMRRVELTVKADPGVGL